jgi:Tfp pilus assembly protein PilX
MTCRKQSGATLVVSLIMLVVLTLLSVSAIRFGLVNLKIVGNTQTEAEASAAAQAGIEQVIDLIKSVENIDAIAAATPAISTGGTSYNVTLAKPTCQFSVAVLNSTLDPTNANDVACFEGQDPEKLLNADGTLTTTPSACNSQQWEIRADVADPGSGTTLSMVQGITVRVPAQVQCTN